MPNHVANEITFESLSQADYESLKAAVLNEKGKVDFEILLPIPLNYWRGSVGRDHLTHFPGNALDWCTKNWSTECGPYDDPSIDFDGQKAVIKFSTAWNTPRGWLCALFNKLRLSFRVLWFSEGELEPHLEIFDWKKMESAAFDNPWTMETPSRAERDRIGFQRWGESWEEIKAEIAQL